MIMCGICGWAAADIKREFDPGLLQTMTRALAHRGPDDEGMFREPGVALGHRRLSILDIAHGSQPFHSPSGRHVLVYNGEVYNAPELRRNLQSRGYLFRTHCDTEVLAVLADDREFSFVNDLEGIFAFALWDRRDKRLLLARDGLGVKPLIYRIDPDGIRFASELKSLYEDRLLPWTLDARALHHYLGLNYIPAPFTIYSEARKLAPGETLEWNAGACRKNYFWQPPTEPGPSRTNYEIGETVRSLVKDSIRGQLQSDVPLGVFLSSGVDSAIVLMASCAYASSAPSAFCVGFHEKSFDERPGARSTAGICGAPLVEFVLEPRLADLIPRMARHFDEPFADSSAVPVWELCRQSVKHVTVALSGEGGDEVFCGYLPYHAHLYADRMIRWHLAGLAPALMALLKIIPASDRKTTHIYKMKRFLPHLKQDAAHRHFLWKVINDEGQKSRLYTPAWNQAHPGLSPTVDLWEHLFKKFRRHEAVTTAALADLSLYLPGDILTKVDISSMAHSLEVRVPLLDRRIVEYVSTLPDQSKIDFFRKKKPMRAAFENNRTRSIFNRPKQGFSIPAAKWLKEDLRTLFLDAVHSDSFRSLGALNPEEVLRLYEAHCKRKEDLSRALWGILMLALWSHSRPA